MTYRNEKLLRLAAGQPCMNCSRLGAVSAHSNLLEHGRGHAHPAHDCFFAWLCHECHAWLDHGSSSMDPSHVYRCTREDKREMFTRAMHRTWLAMWSGGMIHVAD